VTSFRIRWTALPWSRELGVRVRVAEVPFSTFSARLKPRSATWRSTDKCWSHYFVRWVAVDNAPAASPLWGDECGISVRWVVGFLRLRAVFPIPLAQVVLAVRGLQLGALLRAAPRVPRRPNRLVRAEVRLCRAHPVRAARAKPGTPDDVRGDRGGRDRLRAIWGLVERATKAKGEGLNGQRPPRTGN
jgi:hypothetical protein